MAQDTGQQSSGEDEQLPNDGINYDTGYDDATGYRGSPEAKKPRTIPAEGEQPINPALAPQIKRQRALGAYIQNVWTDPPMYISNFNTMVGTPVHIIMYYQNWEQPDKKYFDPTKMDAAVASGAMPMVTWASRDPTQGANQPKYADKNIINREFDSYIKQWAKDAKAWGKPMYLRFDHEMNGSWFPWSPGVNGNTTADWIKAWKHVHHIFTKVGATNVHWVWSPYVDCTNCTPLANVYPGKDYVDWVALDGYNWGPYQSGGSWLTAWQIFAPSYNKITTLVAPNKPLMIAEIASAEAGDDGTKKAQWITDAFSTDSLNHPFSIPNSMPHVQAVVWFSSDKIAQGEADWRVNSTDLSLKAYQDVASSDVWKGSLVQ